jgi:hypothetical protein
MKKKVMTEEEEAAVRLPYGWGFVLLAFPYSAGGRIKCVTNEGRSEVLGAMYEFIEVTKEKWAGLDEETVRLRERVAELEGELGRTK